MLGRPPRGHSSRPWVRVEAWRRQRVGLLPWIARPEVGELSDEVVVLKHQVGGTRLVLVV